MNFMMAMMKMNKKITFIPNWNGHLYLAEKKDESIKYLFEKFKFENSQILEIFQNDIKKTNLKIEKNNSYINICGDHSSAFPIIKSFSKKNNKNFNLVIFDAHPDCEIDCGNISHEDYVRFLVEKKIINPKNIYIFGLRKYSRLEYEFLKKNKINYFSILECLDEKNKIKKILKNLKNIYLSVDVDVMDPDTFPATYYQEYCGLKIEELIFFLEVIKKEIKQIDICEYFIEKENKKKVSEKNLKKLIKFFL